MESSAPPKETVAVQPKMLSSPVVTTVKTSSHGNMKDGLFAVARKPARLCDIKTFQTLHNPRVYGMTEWILQYEVARQRQDHYLNELKDLRQLFSGMGRPLHLAPEAPATITPRRFWTPAWHSNVDQGPKSRRKRGWFNTNRSNETCVLFAKDLTPQRRLHRPEFWSASFSTEAPFNGKSNNQRRSDSSASNRYINIVKNYNIGSHSTAGSTSAKGTSLQSIHVSGARRVKLPPIEGSHRKLDRHKTDYEPFERISRRNKLDLTTYLREERERVATQNSIDLSEVRVQATPIP